MNILVIDQKDWVTPALAQSHYDVVSAEDDVQAYHLAEHLRPALIFLGFDVKKSETPGFIALLLKVCPDTKVVIIGEQLDEDLLVDCLVAGAQGYQERDSLAHYAQRLVLAVTSGEAWLTRKMVAKLLNVIRSLVSVTPGTILPEAELSL